MKMVILESYPVNPGDLSWQALESLGELTVYESTPLDDVQQVIRRIGDAEIVYTNKVPISKEVMDACENLKFIGVLATGYNVVDCSYAAKKGIPVANVPSYGTEAVAQFTIALLLELCHHVGHHDRSVHEGDWEKAPGWCYWDYPLLELSGKTMGIVGFGRIGKATGRIARALGMEVLAAGSRPTEEGRAIGTYVDLNTLLEKSDVISLHCPLTAENRQMIDGAAIRKMKDGVLLINTARGQLLREQDVAEALNSGKLAGAAMDVVSTESIRGDNPLLHAKNCILTPHIAWAPRPCRQRIIETTAENTRAFLEEKPIHVVNGL